MTFDDKKMETICRPYLQKNINARRLDVERSRIDIKFGPVDTICYRIVILQTKWNDTRRKMTELLSNIIERRCTKCERNDILLQIGDDSSYPGIK